MAQTITVQLVGTDGVPRTTGGEVPTFRVEEQCAITATSSTCTPSGGDSISDLPIEKLMTDNNDGTYSYKFFTTGGGATKDVTVTASVSILTGGALSVEYWDNKTRTGEPVGTGFEVPYQNFVNGVVGLSGIPDNASARWQGKVCAPTSETYKFYFRADDRFEVDVNGVSLSGYNYRIYFDLSTTLTANVLSDFDLKFNEGTGEARMFVEWSSPSGDSIQERVPDAAFWSTQRINGVTDIVIAATSTPADSSLESSPAGGSIMVDDTATYTMQSRSALNTAQPTEDDVYTVKLTCNDDELCGSTEYTTTATHTTGGLYSVNLTPTVGGTYDVLITMENAYTAAESSASITVSDNLTLVVINPATAKVDCTNAVSLTQSEVSLPELNIVSYEPTTVTI